MHFHENVRILCKLDENMCNFVKMHKTKFSEIGFASSKGSSSKDPIKLNPCLWVELRGTNCGQLNSAQLKWETVGYCYIIAKLLPSTTQKLSSTTLQQL